MARKSKDQWSWMAVELRRIRKADDKRDVQALDDIHALLDGTEWNSETLEEIADIVRETGREIKEPDNGLHE